MLTWWRHQMETFSALLAICAGNSPVPGEFPTQRPVTRSFDLRLNKQFDLRLNKHLSKQSWGWWFETLSRPLWRHRNEEASSHHLTECWLRYYNTRPLWVNSSSVYIVHFMIRAVNGLQFMMAWRLLDTLPLSGSMFAFSLSNGTQWWALKF